MFDWLVDAFTAYPYLGVAVAFFFCSIGLPLPEELVLIAAGYVCFRGWAEWPWMMSASAGAILLGDLLPFFLGKTFGTRLLRLRPLRLLVNKRRLSRFDRWFRRRGDLVIFFARFIAGLRVVAYFTAGTMRMSYRRFLTLDLLGIALVVPTFIWIGYRFGHIIDDAIERVTQVERGIQIAVVVSIALAVLLYWVRSHRRNAQIAGRRSETYVEPTIQPTPREAPADEGAAAPDRAPPANAGSDGHAPAAGDPAAPPPDGPER